MLDSESRYLPVLSDQSSEASPPQVTSKNNGQKCLTADTARLRHVTADGGVIRPTKSVSDPTSRSRTTGRRSCCPAARTLCLESTDALVEKSVINGEGVQLTDIEQKTTEQTPANNSIVLTLPELYAAGKYGDAEDYGGDSKRICQSFDDSLDTNSCTGDKQSDVVSDRLSMSSAANIVRDHQIDSHKQG